jgi:hypothetical protein
MTPRLRWGAALAVSMLLSLPLVQLAGCGDNGDEGTPPDFAVPNDLAKADGGHTDDDGGGGDDCVGDGGCYACKPTTTDQFLNHCSPYGCSHFDNARLPYYVPGQPLPPVGKPL